MIHRDAHDDDVHDYGDVRDHVHDHGDVHDHNCDNCQHNNK